MPAALSTRPAASPSVNGSPDDGEKEMSANLANDSSSTNPPASTISVLLRIRADLESAISLPVWVDAVRFALSGSSAIASSVYMVTKSPLALRIAYPLAAFGLLFELFRAFSCDRRVFKIAKDIGAAIDDTHDSTSTHFNSSFMG